MNDKTNKQLSKELNTVLNKLLASYQIHYQNLRGLHWNIKGNQFFELHAKYEELYTDAQVQIDEIAERILMNSNQPLHTFKDYLNQSNIKELATTSAGDKGAKYIVNALNTLLKLEKQALDLSGEIDDEGTAALMSDLIRLHEKTNWMFQSWLN
jgi:starvation-inducible DNA-binding protein